MPVKKGKKMTKRAKSAKKPVKKGAKKGVKKAGKHKLTKKVLRKALKKRAVKRVITKPVLQPVATPSPGLYSGKLIHFYPHICVGVLDVAAPLRRGERIRIIHADGTDFEQSVTSMQIEHRQIFEAQKGQQIGIKLLQPAKKGAMVYKQV